MLNLVLSLTQESTSPTVLETLMAARRNNAGTFSGVSVHSVIAHWVTWSLGGP